MSYYVDVRCENCGRTGVVEIEDGVPVESSECPVCSCKKLTLRFGTSGCKSTTPKPK